MTLHVCDISHWQSGLQLGRTGLDGAIMKATDGTGYVDPTCNTFVNQAKAAGMVWGVYHFAHTGSTAEADHFVDSVAGYLGKGLLVLDWEADAVTHGPAAAKNWLDRVYARTGVRPLIYMSQSVTQQFNWTAVAKDYGLWVARYGTSSYGDTGAWPAPVMWQYTSTGRVPGYTDNIDLDHFYGDRDTWTAYATGSTSTNDEEDWFDMATKADLKDAIQEWATSAEGQDAIVHAVWRHDAIPAPDDTDTKSNANWTGRSWLDSIRTAAKKAAAKD